MSRASVFLFEEEIDSIESKSNTPPAVLYSLLLLPP